MAKRQAISTITASFHYLVKQQNDEQDPADLGFSDEEFLRIVERLRDTRAINFDDEAEVDRIKSGENLPFIMYQELGAHSHFGCFEGAYYGQEFRNTRVGTIDAESLNLRRFYYLIERRRDGKIIVGTQYAGNYGDYDGLRNCLKHVLRGNSYKVVSRTFSSIRHEIGDGEPTELKVVVRRQNPRLGGSNPFSTTAVVAVRKAEYGESFADDVRNSLGGVRGSSDVRRQALARLISNGELMEIDDDDIQSCTVIMRTDAGQHTVYLLGGTSFATKFPLNVRVGDNGIADAREVCGEMRRLLDDVVTPGLRT